MYRTILCCRYPDRRAHRCFLNLHNFQEPEQEVDVVHLRTVSYVNDHSRRRRVGHAVDAHCHYDP